MTWEWEIKGLGTTEQTLVVYNPKDEKVGSETRDGWTWSGGWPDAVADLMPTTLEALMALQRGNVERRDGI